VTPDVGPTFLVLSHENVEGGLWALLQLAPLILLLLATFQTFWLDNLMMTSLPLVESA
jgi:hypothetical protein